MPTLLRALVAAFLVSSAVSALSQPVVRQQHLKKIKKENVAGKVLVRYSRAKASGLAARPPSARQVPEIPNGKFVRRIGATGWTLWEVPAGADTEALAKQLKSKHGVYAAQPLRKVFALLDPPDDGDFDKIETDPDLILDLEGTGGSFRRLWHLDETFTEGAWEVWPNRWYTASNKPLDPPLIAVIDSGCDMNHPDFINALGVGSDVTQGGQLDHSLSVSFVDGAVDPSGSPEDLNGHGTHVTGIALAAGNNGTYGVDKAVEETGTIGVGYPCKGMVLRCLGADGTGSDADVAAAIMYAADHGADIINLSVGTPSYSQILQDAVTYAFQKGSLIVAAGNESSNGGGDLGPMYPAACSGVLGVTANGPDWLPAHSSYSGYGYYIDIAAPGGDVYLAPDLSSYKIQYIWSTAMRTEGYLYSLGLFPPYTLNYTYLVGTSMASPMVAGAAGLFYGRNSLDQRTGWANVRAYRALQFTALGTPGMPDGSWEPGQGFGSLDVEALLLGIDSRASTKGSVEGIVYFNTTPVGNAEVRARRVTDGLMYFTNTAADGTYRFGGMLPGTYDVTARPFAADKTKRTQVKAGSDATGVDFWCGTVFDDTTPPVVHRFLLTTQINPTDITVRHWAYDPESTIDRMVWRIGTTPGGTEVMSDRHIVSESPTVKLSGITINLDTTYYLRGTYTNGAGLTTVVTKSFRKNSGTNNASFVSQSAPLTMNVGQSYPVNVTFENTGTATWTQAAGYKLVSQNPGGNTIWGRANVLLTAGEAIANGMQKEFAFNVTAPHEAGDYNFQWRMTQDAVGTFGQQSANLLIHVDPLPNWAKFISQSVPSRVVAGASFTASITLKNTGTNAWTHAGGYRLASYSPANNTTWGTNRVFLPDGEVVDPGEAYTFTRTFTAPSTPGSYVFHWKMLLNGSGTFGQASRSVTIGVTP